VIVIGIDDTDTLHGPGTNQLARRIAAALPPGYALESIVRHQLLFDPRIPYTSKNGSASLVVRVERAGAEGETGGTQRDAPGPEGGHDRRHPARPSGGTRAAVPEELIALVRAVMLEHFQPGSDPGLCVAWANAVPRAVIEFALRSKREPVRQSEAREIARAAGIYLEGLGGTEDGVIGALAAVGLRATGEDGRVVHMEGWTWPDAFAGPQPVAAVLARGVAEIVERETGRVITDGVVHIGKHLRPAYRGGRAVLFVERVDAAPADDPGNGAGWRALKLE
jgi:tRNA(Ile2) C34 agmatinyltransferase TiaS